MSPPVKYFTDRSKAVLILWIIYVIYVLCLSYLRVYSLLPCEILNKLKSKGFLAFSVSTYDFSTVYTTLPHNRIKDKLTELIEQTLNRERSLYLVCMRNAHFSLLNNLKDLKL